MRLTSEVLDKIEDKLWENLEELNKDEKKWIEQGNASHYSMNHFSDSYRYILCINLLQGLKEVVDDDKNYIKHYGLKDFETEEDDVLTVPLQEYKEIISYPDDTFIVLKSVNEKDHYINLSTFMTIFKELFEKDILQLTTTINNKKKDNTISIGMREQ